MKREKLNIQRIYTKNHPGDPFFAINFISRVINIQGEDGQTIFSNNNVIAPDFWSDHACTILAKNYFRKITITDDLQSGEYDLRQVIDRLCMTWTSPEYSAHLLSDEGRFILYDEMAYMLAHQIAAPNSPQWFNTGLFEKYNMPSKKNSDSRYYVDERTACVVTTQDEVRRAQAHACFIVGMEDNLVGENGIYDTISTTAKLFKMGSGCGVNITNLRSSYAALSGGGLSSGPLSFAKIFDASAASIKSGGTTRRAAQMLCVDIAHPDAEDFINWKALEENKLSALVLGSRMLEHFWQQYITALFSFINEPGFNELSSLKMHQTLCDHSSLMVDYLNGELSLDDKTLSNLAAVVGRYAKEGIDAKNMIKTVMLINSLIHTNQPVNKEPINHYLAHIKSSLHQGCYRAFNYDFNGDGVQSISGQSVNISVRIGQEFMEKALECPSSDECALLDKIALRAWESGDPAVQYTGAINNWHTCPASGGINASNPCSEFMFLDNTACNLASINLAKFVNDDGFNYDQFTEVSKLWTIVLDLSITMAQFPTKSIARNSYAFRPLGLGFCNLGYMLSLLKLPYAANQLTLDLVSKISATMTGAVYLMSSSIASIIGPFAEYEKNRKGVEKVLSQHRHAVDSNMMVHDQWQQFIAKTWDDVIAQQQRYGLRNAQATCIAPTGTIGFVMDAATTGIEPEFSYKTWKKVMDGSWMELPSSTFEQYLDNYLSPSDKELLLATMVLQGNSLVKSLEQLGHNYFIANYGPHIIKTLITNIRVANSPDAITSISPYDHIKIMAACQPFISGAISKTINLSSSATINDIKDVYISAFHEGLKGVTIYRDGCKGSQPLNLRKDGVTPTDIIGQLIKMAERQDVACCPKEATQGKKITCPNCQSPIMKPNGSCAVCLNCGSTTGCS